MGYWAAARTPTRWLDRHQSILTAINMQYLSLGIFGNTVYAYGRKTEVIRDKGNFHESLVFALRKESGTQDCRDRWAECNVAGIRGEGEFTRILSAMCRLKTCCTSPTIERRDR